jgi:hypothetical protein
MAFIPYDYGAYAPGLSLLLAERFSRSKSTPAADHMCYKVMALMLPFLLPQAGDDWTGARGSWRPPSGVRRGRLISNASLRFPGDDCPGTVVAERADGRPARDSTDRERILSWCA